MLDIPSTLLDKLQQSMQTIGNNAQPRMDIIAEKAARYLNVGDFLQPRTIRTGNSLGRLDICVRREDMNEEPTEVVMIYIENDIAKIATLPYISTPDDEFEYQYHLGPATSVACDFDGRFQIIDDRTGLYFDTSICWALVTLGEPYFAVINDGDMTLYHGTDDPFPLIEDGTAVECSLLRGWKSVTDVLTDQGLICSYIKTDTAAYYQAYCEQEDGSYIWENEQQLTDFGTPVAALAMFRAADYRTGFMAEVSGNILFMVTDRCWSGMAIMPDHLSARSTMTVDVLEVIYWDTKSDDEHISAESNMTVTVLWGADQDMIFAENADRGDGDYGYDVLATWDWPVQNISGNGLAFTLTDSAAHVFASTAIEQVSSKIIKITFKNFNNAVGSCEVVYTPGTIQGEAGQSQPTCAVTFTPTNLVPFEVIPPVPLSTTNTIDWSLT